jgi:hypothetical protein
VGMGLKAVVVAKMLKMLGRKTRLERLLEFWHDRWEDGLDGYDSMIEKNTLRE